MVILNTADPFNAVMLLAATVLLIFLGKEVKRSLAPQIALILSLIILVIHAIQFVAPGTLEISQNVARAMIYDFLLVAISFFGYLWIDDVESKFRNKKSIDNSLEWFWKKV